MVNKDKTEKYGLLVPRPNSDLENVAAEAKVIGLRPLKSKDETYFRVRGKARQIAQAVAEIPEIKFGVVIENIVSGVNLGRDVDLKKLRSLPEAQYDKGNFPGLVLRLRLRQNVTATFLVFSTGKVVCPGYSSKKTLMLAVSALQEKLTSLKALGEVRENPSSRIENIVAQTILKKKIDLEHCTTDLARVIYEPSQFPGVIYHIVEPVKAPFLLFSTGKVTCTQTRSEMELKAAVSALDETLTEKMLYRTY